MVEIKVYINDGNMLLDMHSDSICKHFMDCIIDLLRVFNMHKV